MSKFKLTYQDNTYGKELPVVDFNCIDIPLHPYCIYMGIGFCKDLEYEGVVYRPVSQDKKWVIQCIFHSKRPPVDIIAHEASHIVENVEKHIGEDLKGEARAYLMGYIVDEIYKLCYNKQTNKRKKK